MTLLSGTKIGRYEIRAKIGAGGMGEVYRAFDTDLDRTVAIKILPPALASNQQRLQRFTQEAKAASALNHPHILTIHEIGTEGATRFIATEFIDGETLRVRVNAGLKLSDILEVATQTASALAAAHDAGIVHRDIKPENIMVRRDGFVKVLDFGLAKLVEPKDSTTDAEAPTRAMVNTDAGTVMGTANYMSPEQAKGTSMDARTDLWSLGAVLYEMIAGQVPFAGETPTETISLILQKDAAPLSRYVDEVPAELERIVAKALTKDRDERYQTAKDFLIDLRNLKRKLEVDAEIDRSVPTEFRVALSTRSGQKSGVTSAGAQPAAGETPNPDRSTHVAGFKKRKIAIAVIAGLALIGMVGIVVFVRARKAEAAIDSIAVLPFENLNQDADSDYLADGITESIINSLTQLPNLKVIARSSVFAYKGKGVDPFVAGKQLGVRAILTGRIVRRGDQLSISAELMEVASNKQIWGERYNEKLSDLLSVQRNIATEITRNLRPQLSGEQERRLARNYTQNAEAYQLYLKGRYYWNKRTEDNYRKAIESFRQAIEIDPSFALAYTGLADTYSFLSSQGIRAPSDVFPLSKEAAKRAIEIDDSLSEAHTSLAYVKLYYDWDLAGAEREYTRAIELNPNYATPHHGFAYLLMSSGRTEQAIAEIKKAENLDPLSLIIQTDHGEFFYFARRPDEAIEQLQKAIEMDPGFVRAHFLMGRALAQKGQCDPAIAEFQKARSLATGGVEMLGALAQGYASCGRKAEARKTLDELLLLSKQHYVSPHWIAATEGALGNRDEAFKWLNQAVDGRFGPLIYLKVNPIWDPLRDDPRFTEDLRRVGL